MKGRGGYLSSPTKYLHMQDDIAAHSDHTAVHLLAEMNIHLKEILAQWFSVQLLDLQNITWESPCDILEKVHSLHVV